MEYHPKREIYTVAVEKTQTVSINSETVAMKKT